MSIAPQINVAAGSLGAFERLALGWQAKLFLFLGLRAKAMTIFKQVLARAPNDVNALNSLAYEAQLQERHAEALGLYQQVAELQPESSNAHFNLAFVMEPLGQLTEAEREFRVAIKLEEKMDRAWYGLGLVLVIVAEMMAGTLR